MISKRSSAPARECCRPNVLGHSRRSGSRLGTAFGRAGGPQLGLLADLDRDDEIAQLEPGEGHGETEHQQHAGAEQLGDELRRVTLKQATHARLWPRLC
jgi:hypothetical protein